MTRTAIKTGFLSCVAIVLIIAVIVLVAPYAAMRFYADCGNERRALECADAYLNVYKNAPRTYYGRYAGVLYSAADLAVRSAEKGDKSAAKQADGYIREYLAIEDIDKKNGQMDAYNLTHSSPNLHPALYSTRAYLENAAYRCRLIVGDASEPALGLSIADATALFNDIASGGDADYDVVSILLKNLSSYHDTGADVSKGEYAVLYQAIRDAFPHIRNRVAQLGESAKETLRQCYYAGTVAGWLVRMKSTANAEDWKAMDVIGDLTVGEYYTDVLLRNYLDNFKR